MHRDGNVSGALYVSFAGASSRLPPLIYRTLKADSSVRTGAHEIAIIHSPRQGMRQPRRTNGSIPARHARQLACGTGRCMEARLH